MAKRRQITRRRKGKEKILWPLERIGGRLGGGEIEIDGIKKPNRRKYQGVQGPNEKGYWKRVYSKRGSVIGMVFEKDRRQRRKHAR